MEGFPENTLAVEEPIVIQAPDAIMEVAEETPRSKREAFMMEADHDTAGFIRSITEHSPLR